MTSSASGSSRSFVRTWLFRGTIHLVASEDRDWIRDLVAPLLLPTGYRRMEQEGLSRDDADRAEPLLEKMLESGPTTRDQMREVLARKGIRPSGRQALTHLLWVVSYRGSIVTGPYRGAKETMVLTRDWLPKPPSAPADPVAELARRYLIAHGPASLDDFRTWAGLRVGTARAGWQAIGEELVEHRVDGAKLSRHRSRPKRIARAGVVRLLPAFDAMFLGYRDRSFLGREPVPASERGGLIDPFVIADGRAVGGWKLERRRAGFDVRLEPFEEVEPKARTAVEREAADVVRFLTEPGAERRPRRSAAARR